MERRIIKASWGGSIGKIMTKTELNTILKLIDLTLDKTNIDVKNLKKHIKDLFEEKPIKNNETKVGF